MVVLGQLQALRPAGGQVDLYFRRGQELADHHQVHVVVVHHQDMRVRGLKALLIGVPLVDAGTGREGKGPQRPFVHNVLLQHDDELGAFGVDAVYADLAAHQIHKLLHDAQAQAGPLDVAVFFFIHPPERVEDIGDVLFLHPHAGVLHGVPDPHAVEPLTLTAHRKAHRALAGVFDRVAQQIDQNLLDAHLVAAEHTGDGGVHMELEFQALFLGLDPDHIDDL